MACFARFLFVGALMGLPLAKGVFEGTIYTRHASQLRQDIFKDYNRFLRPVLNARHQMIAWMELKLLQVIEVNPKRQTASLRVGINFYWFDYKLTWDPKLYGNITELRVERNEIWTPDIYHTENVEMDPANVERHYVFKMNLMTKGENQGRNCSLFNMGFPAILQARCRSQAAKFPWDHIECKWLWASYSKKTDLIDLQFHIYPRKGENFKDSLQWVYEEVFFADIIKRINNDHSLISPGDLIKHFVNDSRSLLLVQFRLNRRGAFFATTLVVPSCIIVQVNLIGMFTMADAEGGRSEKTGLGLASLLALSVLLLVVNDLLPSSSFPVPLLSKIVAYEITLSVIGVLSTAVLMYIRDRYASKNPPPHWLKLLTGSGCKRERTETLTLDVLRNKNRKRFAKHERETHQQYEASLAHYMEQYRYLSGGQSLLEQVEALEVQLSQALETNRTTVCTDRLLMAEWNQCLLVVEFVLLIVFSIAAWLPSIYAIWSTNLDSLTQRAPVVVSFES